MLPAFMRQARYGPCHRYQNLVFWACEGLVVCQDERPGPNGKGDYRVLLPTVLEERVKAMAHASARNRDGYPGWQKIEHRKKLSDLQGVFDCIKEARAMGDPSDPAVEAFWARHRPGAKSTVSMSGTYPELPPLPRGKPTGKTASPTATLTAQDASSPLHDYAALHIPARRKLPPKLITLS